MKDEYIVLTIPKELDKVDTYWLDDSAQVMIFCLQHLEADTFAASKTQALELPSLTHTCVEVSNSSAFRKVLRLG